MKNPIKQLTLAVSASAMLLGGTALATANTVSRDNTVIFNSSRAMKDPGNFNIFRPDEIRDVGLHQAVFEPLSFSTTKPERWSPGWVSAWSPMIRLMSGP